MTWSLVAHNEYVVTWSLVALNESLAHKHCRYGAHLMFHAEGRRNATLTVTRNFYTAGLRINPAGIET